MKVFLTGATGVMGTAGMKEILKRKDLSLRILARKTKTNLKKLTPYKGQIEVVWGDLTNYNDIKRGVDGSDIVLHVGGMVSPAADYRPKTTRKVNIGAAENIVKAVLAQPEDKQPRVVYIGSVAQTGDRSQPYHWGRTGDPIQISIYDHYGITKTIAERIFAESGIKKWVSLRQSGILYANILRNYDPIMFHVPIREVLEWCTVEDSGRVLANVCSDDLPDDFWCKFYNIGSGEQYRLTNYEFEVKLLNAISCPSPEKIFEAKWFVTRNFHGQWYLDSDKLEEILHFRANTPVDEYFAGMAAQLPWFYSLAKVCPSYFIKLGMMPMAFKKGQGSQDWIRRNNNKRISAYYGSKERYEAIGDWSGIDTSHPTTKPIILNHGYDETKNENDFTITDMVKAAQYRGGDCLSESMVQGDWKTKLRWRCWRGHEFDASPNLVLRGGHWCPECMPMPWKYDEEAKHNPFFAQIWYASHTPDEDNTYDEHIFDGWE